LKNSQEFKEYFEEYSFSVKKTRFYIVVESYEELIYKISDWNKDNGMVSFHKFEILSIGQIKLFFNSDDDDYVLQDFKDLDEYIEELIEENEDNSYDEDVEEEDAVEKIIEKEKEEEESVIEKKRIKYPFCSFCRY